MRGKDGGVKNRRFAQLSCGTEVVVRLTPAQLRDHLLLLAETALWNVANSEELGSPQQKDQETFARELKRCAQTIEQECKEHWKDI